MLHHLTLTQITIEPVLVVILGALGLYNFQTLFKFISQNATGRVSHEFVKPIQPYLLPVKNTLEHLFGKASSFKFNLTHVLLMSIVIMLFAVFNALNKNNRLQERQLRALEGKKAKTD